MKLKFELVNGCGVLVENRLIVDGEKYIDSINKAIHTWNMGSGIHEGKSTWCDVIIFAEKELNLEGVPIFEWRDFEPNEKSLLSMFYNVCKATYPEFDEWIEAKEYKKWLEKSNQAKFTEEDLQKAFHAGEERILKREYEKGLSELDSYTNLKKSLQKYPKYIVMCMEAINDFGEPYSFDDMDFGVEREYRPKLFTNSDGKSQGTIKELIWT